MRALSVLGRLQHRLIRVRWIEMFSREEGKGIVVSPLGWRGGWPLDGRQGPIEVLIFHGRDGRLHVLEVEEVLDILLRVTSINLLQRAFVQSEGRSLTGTKDV